MMNLTWRRWRPGIAAAGLFCFLALPLRAQSQQQAQQQQPQQTVEPPQVRHYNWNPLHEEKGFVLGVVYGTRSVNPFEGFIGKFSGLVSRALIGEFRLGRNSSDASVVDWGCRWSGEPSDQDAEEGTIRFGAESDDPCARKINPFYFKIDDARIARRLNYYTGQAVLAQYVRYHRVIVTDRRNVVEGGWPISTSAAQPGEVLDRRGRHMLTSWWNSQSGDFDGRVVKAAVRNNVRQAYRVTVQVGDRGNQFVEMDVASGDIFDFIVRAMSSGRLLRIYFFKLYDDTLTSEAQLGRFFGGYSTPYRLYRVDVH